MSILDQPNAGGGSLLNHTGSILDAQPTPPPQGGLSLRGIEQGANHAMGQFGHWLAKGTASNASGLSQALDYQRRRSQEAVFHKGSSDANREALRQSIPGFAAGYNDPTLGGTGSGNGIPIPGWLQHVIRGTEDTALDIGTDPLTYETLGAGPLLKGLSKGAEWVARGAERLSPETANVARAAHGLGREYFGLGGAAAERLRSTRGQGAKDTVLGAMTHSDAESQHVARLLQQRYDQAFKGLKGDERVQALRALNGEIPIPHSGPVADAVRSVRRTTDDQLYLQMTPGARRVFPLARKGVRTNVHTPNARPVNPNGFEAMVPPTIGRMTKARVGNLPSREYQLPANLREFASVPGEATLSNFRRQYVSGLEPLEEGAESAPRDAFTANPLDYQNPNLLGREDLKIDPKDPERYVEALGRSAKNASKAVGASRLQKRLGDAFGGNIPQEAVSALERTYNATGMNRSKREIVEDAARGITGYGKAATTQLSPMHAANVMALSLLHNPGGTGKVLSRATRLLLARNNPEKAYEILRPGIERGAVGPAKDQELYFSKIPGLAQWSKLMSDITWGVDNAAKTERARSLGDGYSAGRRASEDLIDYRYPSDFSRKHLSLLSRFPTYRSQLMQAVLRGVARNPARAAALMRATGGTLTGDEVEIGGHKLKSYTSVADAGRGAGDPMGFVRSTLGDPQKAALTAAGISHGGNPKYFTYGKNVDLGYLLNAAAAGAPEGRSILDALGLDLFPDSNPASDAAFSLTGTGVK